LVSEGLEVNLSCILKTIPHANTVAKNEPAYKKGEDAEPKATSFDRFSALAQAASQSGLLFTVFMYPTVIVLMKKIPWIAVAPSREFEIIFILATPLFF